MMMWFKVNATDALIGGFETSQVIIIKSVAINERATDALIGEA